jgi:hypothetical protein
MGNRVWSVCEDFRGPMEIIERDHYFTLQQNRVVCKYEDFF